MNKELLLKVKQHILEEPKRLNMHNWIERYTVPEVEQSKYLPSCGTVGCIAGWSFLLGIDSTASEMTFNFTKTLDLLDIDELQAENLFYVEHWPNEFYNKYNTPNIPWGERKQHRAQVTAERIQHFVDTSE